jgi:hypothetical protein
MNPNEELKKALDKIEAFSSEAEKPVTPLERAADLFQTLFSSSYKKAKAEKKASVQKELIKSIGYIKAHLALLDRLKEGTQEQKLLAENALKIIDQFNQSIEGELQRLKIEVLPSVQKYKSGKIDEFAKEQFLSDDIVPSERDLLKMKAIRLVEKQTGNKEAGIDLSSAPIAQVVRDEKSVTLIQTFSGLPGEVTRIVGDFRREQSHSIPIKDSFQVYLESIQHGHPYPMQHMGFSLSHWLVPTSVLWIDQIPLLKPIIERKVKTANDLLPNGSKNLKARRLFRYKKKLFESLKLEYLAFHKELAHTIVRAHPLTDDSYHETVAQFYDFLSKEDHAFMLLSETHQTLNQIFIDTPYESIEEKRLLSDPELVQPERERRELTLKQLFLIKTPSPLHPSSIVDQYLQMMGKIIGDSATRLLTLQLSEKLKLKPAPLSDFDLKIQAASIKHLVEFLNELDLEFNLDNPKDNEAFIQRMRAEIHSEIELFQAPSFEDIDPTLQELVEEIVSYYHAQFHAS